MLAHSQVKVEVKDCHPGKGKENLVLRSRGYVVSGYKELANSETSVCINTHNPRRQHRLRTNRRHLMTTNKMPLLCLPVRLRVMIRIDLAMRISSNCASLAVNVVTRMMRRYIQHRLRNTWRRRMLVESLQVKSTLRKRPRESVRNDLRDRNPVRPPKRVRRSRRQRLVNTMKAKPVTLNTVRAMLWATSHVCHGSGMANANMPINAATVTMRMTFQCNK